MSSAQVIADVLIGLAGFVILIYGLVSLRNALRIRQFHEKTMYMDLLTGLMNLWGLRRVLQEKLPRASSADLFLIDVVSFSEVNLVHGWKEGDRLLRLIAQQLQQTLPSEVYLSHYDGDKFAVLYLRYREGQRSSWSTDEIRQSIYQAMQQALSEVVADGLEYCVASASAPEDGQNWEQLVNVVQSRLSLQQSLIQYRLNEAQRRKERLSALGHLAAGMAHEIRNPLTSIRGFIQLGARDPEGMRKWERLALQEVDRIDRLLTRFLEMADSQFGRTEWLPVCQLVKETVENLQKKSAIPICLELPEHEVCTWMARKQVEQVVIQLVQNAMQALEGCPQPRIRICLEVEQKSFNLIVEDNGPGMGDEELELAITPFYSTDPDHLGLGLPLVAQIVAEHGGEMHLESHPQQGTRVLISFPYEEPASQKKLSGALMGGVTDEV